MARHRISLFRALAALLAATALTACGGGGGDPAAPPPAVGSATLDRAGGTVDGPDGVRLEVPADALQSKVTFRIARDASGAPPLEGINALSPVYAATPHGQTFGATALLSIPLAAAQIPQGTTPILLKAEPGGKWRAMRNGSTDPARMAADVGELSFFVIAGCSDGSGNPAWVIGRIDCPSGHELRITMRDGQNQPVQAVRDPNGVQMPLWTVVDTVQTRSFTVTWTRPPGTTRTDQVAVYGFGSGITPNPRPPRDVQVSSDFSTTFTVTIDPAQVTGAGATNGKLVRVGALANYSATAFQVGYGNVGTGFEFATDIPILVRYTGAQPQITQQPTPPDVSVLENGSFTLSTAATGANLSYQWRYFQNAGDGAVRVAEGTNNQATYTSPPAPLGFNGRLYYAHICSQRGVAGLERCVTTQTSSLTVTQVAQAAAFTTQPVNRDILQGEGVNFAAVVTGTPTPTLQWHYGVVCRTRPIIGRTCTGAPFANGAGPGALAGATVGGATTATLNLNAVPFAASGTTVALAATQPGSANAVWSDVATLTVRSGAVAPAITAPLTPQTTSAGGSATFSVGVSGSEPISVTWNIQGLALNAPGMFSVPGTNCTGSVAFFDNNRRIVLSNLTAGCSGLTVVAQARNGAGGPANSSALLTVTGSPTAPSIAQQPAASAIPEDTPATLRVGYGGTGPVTLALQRLVGGNWTNVSITLSTACASPCSIQTPALPLADNGAMFRVRLSNTQGSIDSNAVTITVNIARSPVFIAAPANAAVDANLTTTAGTADFAFTLADEIGTLSWQWLLNGQPLADGSGVAGNGVLQQATVAGTSGTQTPTAPGTLTLSNLPLAANGARLSVRVTRTDGGQSRMTTSAAATLTVNTGIPADALTATQIVAGQGWSMVLRPDRSVWAWGLGQRSDGSVQYANLLPANEARRPVRMYPAVLTDVRAISGWFNSYWALKGEPGSSGSRVLHWGRAYAGSDGRGGDGNGSLGSSIPPRDNEAAPVEVLERVNNVPQPVDRVCAIAGGGEQLAMIRAIDSSGNTTDCNAGSAKTVWFVGSLLGQGYGSTGVAFAMPGLPVGVPPAVLFTGKTTSGSPPLVIALEDGRVYGLGQNPYGGLGVAAGGSGVVGGLGGPLLLPSTWGDARSFGMSFYYSLFAVRADGSVVTSGYDGSGELGLGSVIGGNTLGPVPVLAESCASLPCADVLTGVTAIAGTTAGVTLALKNGQVLGWGAGNSAGLRGPGATTAQPFPRSVPSTVAGFTALSASHTHALVIGPGNAVHAWGSNQSFALGDTQDRAEPTLVTVP